MKSVDIILIIDDAFDHLVHDDFPRQTGFWYRNMCCTCEALIKYNNGVAPGMSKNVRNCLINSEVVVLSP